MTTRDGYPHAMAAALAGVNMVTRIAADGRPIGRTASAMLSSPLPLAYTRCGYTALERTAS
jgi:hypothetical protein